MLNHLSVILKTNGIPIHRSCRKAGVVKERSWRIRSNWKIDRVSMASLIVEAYKLDSKVNGTPATKFSDLEKVGVKQKLTF